MKADFNEEVMFAGWNENHKTGAKVTFFLKDSASLEAFRTMTVAKGKTAGQRLAMCLVEIADDERPVQRTQALDPIAQAEAIQKAPALTGLALLAVQWCKEPKFWEWLYERYQQVILGENEAKELVCFECGIQSRKQLNTNKSAADYFNRLFREPYMEWLKNEVR